MTAYTILQTLKRLGCDVRAAGGKIQVRWQGPGEPDPSQVAPLLEALKAHKRAALALLEAEMAGDNPSCKTCPWCLDNPWSRYPDLPLWCGWWWDHLRADSGWCYERRHGQVPDPSPRNQETNPVRAPLGQDFTRGKGNLWLCCDCGYFRPSGGENPAQAWGTCTKTGKGRYGVARACDALVVGEGKEKRA